MLERQCYLCGWMTARPIPVPENSFDGRTLLRFACANCADSAGLLDRVFRS